MARKTDPTRNRRSRGSTSEPNTRRARSQVARRLLRKHIRENSYVRTPDLDQRRELKAKYKKGYELRIVVRSVDDVERVSAALIELGFKPGKPFEKARQFVVPVYGPEAVELWSRVMNTSR